MEWFDKIRTAYSRPLVPAVTLALGFFLLYLNTMPPVNVGYADSDELLTVAYQNGIAHPPGYPLYLLLLSLFTHFPISSVSVAFKGHLLSAVMSVFTLVFTYLSALMLHRLAKPGKKHQFILISLKFESHFLAGITTSMLALTTIYWLYSQITEKYLFSALLVALFVYLGISYLLKKDTVKLLYLWVVLGFAISHHQVLGLLLFPTLYLSLPDTKKSTLIHALRGVLLAVAVILTTFLLILAMHKNGSPVSWALEPSLLGILSFWTRQDFSGLVYGRGVVVNAYIPRFDVNQSIQALMEYAKFFTLQVGWWFVPILALALRYGTDRHRRSFIFLGLSAFFIGPFLAAYLHWPTDWGSLGVLVRQFVPGLVPLVLVFWFGWYEVLKRLGSSLNIIAKKTTVAAVIITPIIIALITKGVLTYPVLNLSNFTLVSDKYSQMMAAFEPGSLVTCYSDTSCFALLYEKYVNQKRDDIDIVPLAYPLVTDVIDKPGMRGFTYDSNPYLLFDIVTWNLDKRPVYAVELNDNYYNMFGINYPYMYYVPLGYYGLLTRQIPDVLPTPPTYDISTKWLQTKTDNSDPYRNFLKSTIARDHLLNGMIYLKMDRREWAQNEFDIAVNTFFQFGEREKREITGLRNSLEQEQPNPKYQEGTRIESAQVFLEFIPQLLEGKFYSRAYMAAQAAVAVEPLNVNARLALAQIYEIMEETGFAKREYTHVLMLEPNNQTAREKLSQL